MSNYSYIASKGQSPIDIAVERYGSELHAFQLLADNPGLMLDTVLSPGQELTINEALAAEKDNRAFDHVSFTTQRRLSAQKEVIVREGQSLTDLAIEHYGDVSYLFQLLEDNPQLQAPDTEAMPGDLLLINRKLSDQKPNIDFQYISLVSIQKEPEFRQTEVYEGQSVLDMALQEYGDIEAALDLLTETNTDDIGSWSLTEPGSTISIRKNRVYDADVTTYYQNRNIRINTGTKSLIEGIGLCSSDGILLVTIDNFILKASDQ